MIYISHLLTHTKCYAYGDIFTWYILYDNIQASISLENLLGLGQIKTFRKDGLFLAGLLFIKEPIISYSWFFLDYRLTLITVFTATSAEFKQWLCS